MIKMIRKLFLWSSPITELSEECIDDTKFAFEEQCARQLTFKYCPQLYTYRKLLHACDILATLHWSLTVLIITRIK